MQPTSCVLHPSQLDIFVDQFINNESPHYNIGGYIKLIGRLDTRRFVEALASAIMELDVFKMRFNIVTKLDRVGFIVL